MRKSNYLVNMVGALAGELLNLTSVRALKRRVAAHIWRLEEMKGMSWHAESKNLVLCAILVEIWRSVATMAVKDKKLIDSSCTRRCMLIDVLYPLKTKLICRPAIIGDAENPV